MIIHSSMAFYCLRNIRYITRTHRHPSQFPILCAIAQKSTDASVDPNHLPNSKILLPNRYIGQPSWKTHPYLISADETTPGISRNEYAQRREKFMKKLLNANIGKDDDSPNLANIDHLVIMQASPTTFSAPDVPHPFRQDSNFLYLSGFQESDSIFILYNDLNSGGCKSVLFVDARNEHKELWEGPRAGVDGALALTGVDFVYEKHELTAFLENYVKRQTGGRRFAWWSGLKRPLSLSNASKSFPIFGKDKTSKINLTVDQYLSQYGAYNALDPLPHIHRLRWIKSNSEIELLRKAGRIGAESLIETMRISHADIVENTFAGKMDYECRLRGANHIAYPPVVAGGPRANIIHYLNNDQRVTAEENLVLMDAGCEVYGYVSDITRTWPVTGRFTDPQRILYEIVYNVQMELLAYVANKRPITLRDIFLRMMELLAVEIRDAGILKRSSKDDDDDEVLIGAADRYCPHHVSHYLGMDVHDTDTVRKDIDLQTGVVITVEPGLYIKPDDVNVNEEFRGYGIRIEDDILITDSGIEVLSDACPKSVTDIENIIRSVA